MDRGISRSGVAPPSPRPAHLRRVVLVKAINRVCSRRYETAASGRGAAIAFILRCLAADDRIGDVRTTADEDRRSSAWP